MVLAVVRNGDQRGRARLRHHEWLGACIEDAVPTLELRPVDGEVGLVDQLVRVGRVAREGGDPDRHGGANRLARGFDVDRSGCDCSPDPLGDLEGQLGRRLRQEDRELLAAEASGDVVVAQLCPERLGDALEHSVAGKVAVGVVDIPEEVEVGHDQRHRPLEPLRTRELLRQRRREVTGIEQSGLGVDARLFLQLRDAQRPMDQQQRRNREGQQPGVDVPESRDADTESREHEVGREALEREDAELPDRVAVEEVQHRRKQDVIDRHEHSRRRHPR